MLEIFTTSLAQSIRQTANAFACYDGGVFLAGGNARRFSKVISSSKGFHYTLNHSYPAPHQEKIRNMPVFLIDGDASKYVGTLGAAVQSFRDKGLIE